MQRLGRALTLCGIVAAAAVAQAAEPVAVLTEIQARQGQVQVRAAGDATWTEPGPLQALRPGDQVRVSGDGHAALLFAGGRGARLVTRENSPFSVEVPAGGGATGQLRVVLGELAGFLVKQGRERTYQPLAVRSITAEMAILAPRSDPEAPADRLARVLAGRVVFEWSGPERARYRVRVSSPEGVVWEAAGVERGRLAYPASGPALAPGAMYTWELSAREHGVQRARFQVMPAAAAAGVRETLALLAPDAAAGYSPATLALLRAGLLVRERLYAEARRELLAAMPASPGEPALHLMLGHVYDRTGLRQLAGQEFDTAASLAGRKP